MDNLIGLIFSKQEGKKEEQAEMVGKEFVTKNLDPEIATEIDNQQDELEKLSASQELPKWFNVSKMVMLASSILMLFIYSFFDQYSWSMVFIIAGLVLVILIAVLTFIGNRRTQKNNQKKEAQVRAMIPKINATYKKAKRYMGIPDSAKEMDIMTQRYVYGKDGSLIEKGLLIADCANIAQYVYLSGKDLTIAGIDKIFTIPLTSVKELRRVDKKTTVRGWNKKVSPKDERFKQFGLKCGRYDVYTVKWFYEIVVEDECHSGVIRVMPYELSAVKKLIKMDVSNENA